MQDSLFETHKLIRDWLSSQKLKINFELEVRHKVIDGAPHTSLDIKVNLIEQMHIDFLKEKLVQHKKMLEYYKEHIKHTEDGIRAEEKE